MKSNALIFSVIGVGALALFGGALMSPWSLADARAAGKEARTIVYTSASTPIFDGAKGKVMGSLPPGTPLVQLSKRGKRVKIQLEAWSRAYAPLRLVSDPVTFTSRGELVRIPDGVREVTEQKVDKYSARWEEVRVTGWVPARGLVQDVNTVWKEARALQQERCTVCHEFKQPDLLNASQWRGTLVIMGHRASLTPEERALLSQYLQANASKHVIE